jgi:hypothetical protein
VGQGVFVIELNIVVLLGTFISELKEMNDKLINLAEADIQPKSEEVL